MALQAETLLYIRNEVSHMPNVLRMTFLAIAVILIVVAGFMTWDVLSAPTGRAVQKEAYTHSDYVEQARQDSTVGYGHITYTPPQ